MSIFRLLLLLCLSFPAFAQEWPTKPVKFVSPYPPGGSVDPLARILAAKLTESLKQQFIVENRTGASGIIGTDYVAKSAPDGYTFVFIFDTHAVHQALNPNLPFDPVKDFAPVMIVGTAPMAITTGAMKPYRTFADVIAAAKARPDTVTLGNVGNGSLAHLTTIVLNQAAGIRLVPVPYKGGGPLSTDLMGGQVELGMASTAAQAQHVRGGKMRALVLTGDKRSHTMPDVPTLREQGDRRRGPRMVGHPRARRHARADHRQAAFRIEQGIESSRREKDARRDARDGCRRAEPRGDAEVDRRADGPLGESRSGKQHPRRMK